MGSWCSLIPPTHAVMHNEFVKQEQNVNQCYYTDTSWHLRENTWQKLRKKWNSGIGLSITMTMHLMTLLCLHMNLWPQKKVLPHPPYSQHLALSLPKLKGSIFNITITQAELWGKTKFQTWPSQNASNVGVIIQLTMHRRQRWLESLCVVWDICSVCKLCDRPMYSTL